MTTRRLSWFVLKFFIAATFLYYVFQSGKISLTEIFTHAANAKLYILLACVCLFVTVCVHAVRFSLLARACGLKSSMSKMFHLTWIGQLFNNFLWGSVGGDAWKMYYLLKQNEMDKFSAAATIPLDRLLGLYALLLVVGGLAPVVPQDGFAPALQYLLQIFQWSAAVSVFVFAICLYTKPKLKNITLLNFISTLQKNKRDIISSLVLAICGQVLTVVSFYLTCQVLLGSTDTVAFTTVLSVFPLGLLLTVLPLSPAGIGVGQFAFSELFASVGILNPTLGANAFSIWQMLGVIVNCLGLFSYLKFSSERTSVALDSAKLHGLDFTSNELTSSPEGEGPSVLQSQDPSCKIEL